MSKSVKSAATSNSKSSKRSGRTEELDASATKFIDEKLPLFFGVKAAHHQASVIRGRNPKSLPKDSELWMYSRISNKRKNLIERGRTLWDVVDEGSLEKHHEEHVKKEESRRKSPARKSEEEAPLDAGPSSVPMSVGSPNPTANVANRLGHMGEQLKTALQNKVSALDIKINFKHRAPVAYGMTFLIRNFNDEVLYMHRLSADNEAPLYELRMKPMSQVEPHDRIKFKALDLVNPSNPKTIRFGDPVWLQCVVDEDNPNILAGFAMTSKVFEPPHLQSVKMEYHPHGHHHGHGHGHGHGHHDHHSDHHTQTHTPQHHVMMSPQSAPSAFTTQGATQAASNAAGGAQQDGGAAGDNDSVGSNDEEEEDDDDMSASQAMSSSPRSMRRGSTSRLSGISNPAQQTQQAQQQTQQQQQQQNQSLASYPFASPTHHQHHHHNQHDAYGGGTPSAPDLCGFVQVSRIADNARLFDGQPPPDSAQALKNAMRYNSRQTMVLGKWIFTDGLRREQHEARMAQEARERQQQRRKGGATGPRGDDAETDVSLHGHGGGGEDDGGEGHGAVSQVLMSLSPIVLQQDAYCLGSAQVHEVHKWPLTSFDILSASYGSGGKPSSQSSAQSQQQPGGGVGGGGSVLSPSSVKSGGVGAGSVAGGSKLSPGSSVTAGGKGKGGTGAGRLMGGAGAGTEDVDGGAGGGAMGEVEAWNSRYLKHLEHMKKGGILPAKLESIVNVERAKRSNRSSSAGSIEQFGGRADQARHGYGMLRRYHARGAPYDFAVDRRCIWQLCVYEEFSDNFLELSSKEKHAKAVMEMASMALKISKMNREGATLHIAGNEADQLPPLVGGESFARTLREITFKTNQRAEQEYLRARRIREYKLGQHFASMIPEVLERDRPLQSSISNSNLNMNASMMRPSTSSTISSNSSATDDDEDEEGEGEEGGEKKRAALEAGGSAEVRQGVTWQDNNNSNSNSYGIAQTGSRPRSGRQQQQQQQHRHKHHHGHHRHHTHHHQLSDEIRRAFTSDVHVPTKEDLLLISPDKVHHYKELSGGEQVLALHRTMHYYTKLTSMQLLQQAQLKREEDLARAAKMAGAPLSLTMSGAPRNLSMSRQNSLRRTGTPPSSLSQQSSSSSLGVAAVSPSKRMLKRGGTSSSSMAQTLELSHTMSVDDPDTSAAVAHALAIQKRKQSTLGSTNRKNQGAVSASVLKKLEKLQAEDANIAAALNYKGSLERNPLELEHRSYD